MKYTFWGYGIIMFGLFGLIFLVMFESITVNNESEYYVLREAMEAAMLESVDFACYRIDTDCGDHDVKIIEQKFVENFTRRFAASISGDVQEYTIQFYDIIEKPPKATVVIKGKTKEFFLDSSGGNGDSFDLINNLSGILEIDHSKEIELKK